MTVYYGLLATVESHIANWFTLDNINNRLSVRFTAMHNKTVSALHMNFMVLGVSPSYTVGLQADVNGEPSGIWLGYGTVVPVAAFTTFVSVTLDNPVALTRETVYHIVVEYNSGVINAANCARILRYDVLADTSVLFYPDEFADDAYKQFTMTDGITWIEVTDYPRTGWLLEYSDGTGYGFGYSELFSGNIHGLNQSAEKIVGYKKEFSTIGLYLRREGAPPDNLYLRIYNVTDAIVLATGTITAAEVAATYSFIQRSFDPNIVFEPDKEYRIELSSPGSNVANHYRWLGFLSFPILAIYQTASWQGTTCVYTLSADGGASWTDTPNNDLIFRFVWEFETALKTSPSTP